MYSIYLKLCTTLSLDEAVSKAKYCREDGKAVTCLPAGRENDN